MDVGVEINQYKVIEHIGRGGMADVWSARDQRLNRMVAIKTIAHGLSQDADPVALFKQEAQTIAQMEHPHILPIYDFGEYKGSLYIVMRYVSGGSLEDLLRRGPLPLDEALRLGQAIAQALDYAHSNSVIHLDLKPANVLLDSHRAPYLGDFGLATSLDPEGKAMNPGSGTLLYMAPEQMTAEIIDHRADIFSFCIVMFHMLTGQLPFEGAAPLALKQVQYRDELPDVDILNPSLPSYFTEVLRRGTAVNPVDRPSTLMEIVSDLRDVMTSMSNFEMLTVSSSDEYGGDYDPFAAMDSMPASTDMVLLEAVDIYSRARHNWAGGNGRFLLGVTHFMLMSGYYIQAEELGLELDVAGKQMLLRGALEYDHDIEYWWKQLEDADRRWVCLHALRSGNAPARVRALYRLETLPDAENPQIPKLVAQMLQLETDEEARLAALQVLGTRAKLVKDRKQYTVETEYRGRMLTTMTRIGIQVTIPAEWREVVYTPEIDLLIATIALDQAMPRVSEFAARVIGRIRSTSAVRFIVAQQAKGRPGALRALALVRDEAPNLPPVVTTTGRLYAWVANTGRRLFDNPWGLFFRFVAALVGGWLAMGMNVWVTFRTQAFFTPQRWGNTLAIGLMFGVFTGLLVIFSGEFSERLRGFWLWWFQIIVTVVMGFFFGLVVWSQFAWMYLQQNFSEMYWLGLVLGSTGIMFGFVVTAIFNLRGWMAIPLTAIATYLPVLATWKHYQEKGTFENGIVPLIYYFDNPQQVYTVAFPMALMIAIGGHFPRLWRDLRSIWAPRMAHRRAAAAPVELIDPTSAIAAARPKSQDLHTELDINLGKSESQEMELRTELDVQQQVKNQYMGDEAPGYVSGMPEDAADDIEPEAPPKKHDSRRVNIGTGIRINRTYPASEDQTEPRSGADETEIE